MGTVNSPCVRCSQLLPIDTAPSKPQELRCGHCGTKQIQAVYPAGYLEIETTPSENDVEGGATCFFHGNSDAVNLCDDCGRYLCELCTLPIPLPANCPPDFPEQLCPACFEHRVEHEQKHQHWDLFRTSYPRYDVIAGFLVVLPIILFPLLIFSIVTLPVAVFMIIRYWRFNRTPVKRFRSSMIATLGVALLGIFVWLTILVLTVAENF